MNFSLLLLSATFIILVRGMHRKDCELDVAIWFDNSEFFPGTRPALTRTKAMVAKIVIALGVCGQGTHIALGGISENPQVFMPFSEEQSISHVMNVLGRVIVRPNQYNRLDKALLLAKGMLAKARGGRENAKKVLIVLTNGIESRIANDVPEVGELAHELSGEGVEAFAIGLGSDINIMNLLGIVSYDAERVHRNISPEFLSQLQKIKDKTCK